MKARFELSKSKVLEQYNIAKKYGKVSYSFKTNYEVGEILEKETDCEFSLHSSTALKKLKDKTRAWYFVQAWEDSEIDEVIKLGCCSFVVDNEPELRKLLIKIEEEKINIKLLLRMRLKEHTIHTGKHFVYGMYTKEINKLVPDLAKHPLIRTLGLHVHRKTQNVSEWSLQEEFEQSLTQETLDNVQVVNLGGGIPGIYKNFRSENLKLILDKIKKAKDWLSSKEIETIIEPGRFIASSSIKLIAEIKNIYDNNIILNCSIFNGALDTWIASIRLLVEGELEKGDAYVIKGCSPDSPDIFRYRVYLENPKVGDKITFLNAGAYNFSTDFCLLPKLPTVIVS